MAITCLQVLELFGASIGLTPKQVLKIMAEADNNDNGVIEYVEFLPVATEIIQVRFRSRRFAGTGTYIPGIAFGISYAVYSLRHLLYIVFRALGIPFAIPLLFALHYSPVS